MMIGFTKNYFESKGICFENNVYCNSYERLKDALANYLDAQCSFGLKINGKVFGSKDDEDSQKLTKAKQQEIKDAIWNILDDFAIKTKADFFRVELFFILKRYLKFRRIENAFLLSMWK